MIQSYFLIIELKFIWINICSFWVYFELNFNRFQLFGTLFYWAKISRTEQMLIKFLLITGAVVLLGQIAPKQMFVQSPDRLGLYIDKILLGPITLHIYFNFHMLKIYCWIPLGIISNLSNIYNHYKSLQIIINTMEIMNDLYIRVYNML